MKLRVSGAAWFASLALGATCLLSVQASGQNDRGPGWVAGDFHQHTTYTDGSNSFATVMYKNDQFGLDWWANSEHGGAFPTDARGPLTIDGPFDVNGGFPWTSYSPNPVIGGGANMFRWQSLRDYAFYDTLAARATYDKPILQSFEWNVPKHEHCSLGLIAGQFPWNLSEATASAIAQFEYLFDANDSDVNGGQAQGWSGKTTANTHQKAVDALAWLEKNYRKTSYAVFAHPERKGTAAKGGYDINDFRDFNNAAPDVAFGFESMPGHQKESGRGGYGSGAYGGGTFGGVGAYAATVGGLWDAMLGEGRGWWLFASSDFHNTTGDFWPGEYQKTYTYVANRQTPRAIVDGLRSGNSFVVEGDLIDALDFSVQYRGREGDDGADDGSRREEGQQPLTRRPSSGCPKACGGSRREGGQQPGEDDDPVQEPEGEQQRRRGGRRPHRRDPGLRDRAGVAVARQGADAAESRLQGDQQRCEGGRDVRRAQLVDGCPRLPRRAPDPERGQELLLPAARDEPGAGHAERDRRGGQPAARLPDGRKQPGQGVG